MTPQIGLFDPRPLYDGNPPHVAGSDTSKAAADAIKESADSIRRKVYNLIGSSRGLTCDEVEAITNLRHQTASARIRELVLQGRLYDSKERRATRSGRMAAVYKVRGAA